jgi:hypothetical protein
MNTPTLDTRRIVSFWQEPRYFWITRAVIVFVVTRLIVLSAAYSGEIALPDLPADGTWHARPDNVFVDVWARWDSGYYLDIARRGYWHGANQDSAVDFFPMYPLLIDLVKPLAGDRVTAGILISHVALLGALMLLYRLTELEFHDHGTASRTIFYIAIFPTSFFFSAVYTESLFLLFSVGCVYFARKRLWAWAALLGVLSTATRLIGITLWGVVGLEWLYAHGWTFAGLHRRATWRSVGQGVRRDAASLAVINTIPLGLLSYMLFLQEKFGDPIAFATVQKNWGRELRGPLAYIGEGLDVLIHSRWRAGNVPYEILANVVCVLAALALAVWVWRRLGATYGLYSALAVLVPLSSGLGSLVRFIVVIFPLFMVLGSWGRRPWLDRALIALFGVFLGIFTLLFVNWIFVA